MKIGFTGTQIGTTTAQRAVLMQLLVAGTEFHHGDCVGADENAHAIASSLGLRTVCHPPINPAKRAFTENDETREPKDYIARNHDIVDETDFLLATPKFNAEELRSGTWATIRYAKKSGKRVGIIFPDGSINLWKPEQQA